MTGVFSEVDALPLELNYKVINMTVTLRGGLIWRTVFKVFQLNSVLKYSS